MERKTCPFSFVFQIKKVSPVRIARDDGHTEIKIGFPCIGQKCTFWDDSQNQCILWTIKSLLKTIYLAVKEKESGKN